MFSAASRIQRSDPGQSPCRGERRQADCRVAPAWRPDRGRSARLGGRTARARHARLRAERGRRRRARSAHCQDGALSISTHGCASAGSARSRCAGFRRTFAVRRPLASAPTSGTTCGSSSTRPTRSTRRPGWRGGAGCRDRAHDRHQPPGRVRGGRDDRGSLHVAIGTRDQSLVRTCRRCLPGGDDPLAQLMRISFLLTNSSAP